MTTYIKRPKLNAKKREALAAYYFDEVSRGEAAEALGMKRQNLPNVSNNLLKALVMEGKIDIVNLLKDF